jgi:hypothetical protein
MPRLMLVDPPEMTMSPEQLKDYIKEMNRLPAEVRSGEIVQAYLGAARRYLARHKETSTSSSVK